MQKILVAIFAEYVVVNKTTLWIQVFSVVHILKEVIYVDQNY